MAVAACIWVSTSPASPALTSHFASRSSDAFTSSSGGGNALLSDMHTFRRGRCSGRLGRSLPKGSNSIRVSLQPPETETGREEVFESNVPAEKIEEKIRPKRNELNEAVRKTAATFAPRASTASKNPAPPGSTLYKVFEAQAYVAMVLGGALSFNLLFPSDQPDIWRLMGMWSVWMFTVPSLRARDCSKKEKEALNYLFIAIPLINVTLPIVWRSFAAVWSMDVLAFLAIYAWKMEWFSNAGKLEDS